MDDDDKSFRSFLLLLRMRNRTLSVKESPASEAMGVREREFDRDMQGSGVHVTHTGAQVLGQRAGLWAYPLLDGWVEPGGSHSTREPNWQYK